ncbi:MAG: hypothetical protein AB1476_05155 [Candidatus Hadarchaeota archaeon]
MKKIVFSLALILAISMAGLAKAETGRELIENSRGFDGKRVTLQGEVIGVLIKENYAWINIWDNGFAIGIWSSAANAKSVSFVGDYTHVGDTVLVDGIFHMVCPEHGGDIDIHAENFAILAAGREIPRLPDPLLTAASVLFVGFAFLLYFWLRHLRKERGKIVPWPMPWR